MEQGSALIAAWLVACSAHLPMARGAERCGTLLAAAWLIVCSVHLSFNGYYSRGVEHCSARCCVLGVAHGVERRSALLACQLCCLLGSSSIAGCCPWSGAVRCAACCLRCCLLALGVLLEWCGVVRCLLPAVSLARFIFTTAFVAVVDACRHDPVPI